VFSLGQKSFVPGATTIPTAHRWGTILSPSFMHCGREFFFSFSFFFFITFYVHALYPLFIVSRATTCAQ
jgi:hypothetical protein